MLMIYFLMRKIYVILPFTLLLFATYPTLAEKQRECTQGSTCVSVNSSNDALSSEQARQSQQQWNDTKKLRHKINTRTEKEFDKLDLAINAKNRCVASSNTNAYWEPSTERCLNRRTGHPIMP